MLYQENPQHRITVHFFSKRNILEFQSVKSVGMFWEDSQVHGTRPTTVEKIIKKEQYLQKIAGSVSSGTKYYFQKIKVRFDHDSSGGPSSLEGAGTT